MTKAKEAIKGIAMLVGFTVVFIGLCIFISEAPTLDKQLGNFGLGFATMVVGAVAVGFGAKGSDFFD